jgi:dCTP deaminase
VVLSDRTIRRLLDEGRIGIDPYEPALMQPSSLDVRVDRYFRVFRNSRYPFIDVKAQQEDLTELVEVAGEEAFILHPGEFVLGSTLERVTLPDDLVARLEGKSSLGRLGLLIHSTAGFIDPGWDGHVTLELSNRIEVPGTARPHAEPLLAELRRKLSALGGLGYDRTASAKRPPLGSYPRPESAHQQIPLLRILSPAVRRPFRRRLRRASSEAS